MNYVNLVAIVGGLFASFSFVHFLVDWLFQSHNEAMCKHNNSKVRAKHCAIYAIGFIPFLLLLGLTGVELFISVNILFWSHFIIDTYYFTFLWIKYIRNPPMFSKEYFDMNTEMPVSKSVAGKRAFVEYISTPVGCILMIVVDQLTHMLMFGPIIYMALN